MERAGHKLRIQNEAMAKGLLCSRTRQKDEKRERERERERERVRETGGARVEGRTGRIRRKGIIYILIARKSFQKRGTSRESHLPLRVSLLTRWEALCSKGRNW